MIAIEQAQEDNSALTLADEVTRISDTLAGITSQIGTLEKRLATHQEELASLDRESISLHDLCTALDVQVVEAETALRQAQMAASIASGTASESAMEAGVKDAAFTLEAQKQRRQEAIDAYGQREKKMSAARARIEQALKRDEDQLSALQQQQRDLTQLHARKHEQLGQATYSDLAAALGELDEVAQTARELLSENRLTYMQLQYGIEKRLAAWPELAQLAQTKYGRQSEQKEDATTRALTALIATWRALEQSPAIRPAREMTPARMQHLLTIDQGTIQMLLGKVVSYEDRVGFAQQRGRDLYEWLKDHCMHHYGYVPKK